jgi:Phage Mu protein F like protein
VNTANYFQRAGQREQARLAAQLRRMFQAQARELLSRLSPRVLDGAPLPFDLSHWTGPMVTASEPFMLRAWQVGMVQSRERVALALRNRQGGTSYGKALGDGWGGGGGVHGWLSGLAAGRRVYKAAEPQVTHRDEGWQQVFPQGRGPGPGQLLTPTIGSRFDLTNPKVRDAVHAACLMFCRETNETAVGELHEALKKLRLQLAEGLDKGEALRTLAGRVLRIFADPYRAHRIAATESKRALEAGSLMSAKESGVVSKMRWLTSSDGCEDCQLLDGKEVDLDEPFHVGPGGGPYAVTKHPPRHPNCFCTMTEVL